MINMEEKLNTLYIMVGLPGAGKDTVIKQTPVLRQATEISSDKLRVELYGFEDQTHNTELFQEMERRTIEAGKNKEDVVYNATNLNRARRVGLCQRIKKYFSYINVIVVICPIEELYKRNACRKERKLSGEVLNRMLTQFQIPTDFEYPYNHIYFLPSLSGIYYENYNSYNSIHRLDGYDQNNKYHSETLGSHIARVMDYCRNTSLAQIAASYHDLGKVYCRTIDEEGWNHYIGHPNVSTYMYTVDAALNQNGNTGQIFLGREITLYHPNFILPYSFHEIALMIEYHDYIFSFEGDFEKMRKKLQERFPMLSEDFFIQLEILIKGDRLRP